MSNRSTDSSALRSADEKAENEAEKNNNWKKLVIRHVETFSKQRYKKRKDINSDA